MRINPFHCFQSAAGRPRVGPCIEVGRGLGAVPLAGIPVLVILLAGGIAAGLRHSASAPPPARAAGVEFGAHETQLRRRLREQPGDHAARLQLSCCLLDSALYRVQGAYPQRLVMGPPDGPAYRTYLAATLSGCTSFLKARRLAEGVAKDAGDPHLRARAGARLSRIAYYMEDPAEQLACLAMAAREDPANDGYREVVASLRMEEGD